MELTLEDWIKKIDDKGQYSEDENGLRFRYKRWRDQCVNPEYDKFKEEK